MNLTTTRIGVGQGRVGRTAVGGDLRVAARIGALRRWAGPLLERADVIDDHGTGAYAVAHYLLKPAVSPLSSCRRPTT